jgi:hypothetical protein
MFGNLRAIGLLSRTGLLLTGLVVAMVVAGGVNAAHLPLPILFTPVEQAEFNRFLAERPVPTSEAERKRLFQEFLSWRKTRQLR